MLRCPRIKPFYQIEILPGKGVLVLDGERSALLRGQLLETLLPLIDGKKTTDEIVALSGQDPVQAHFVLMRLARDGYLRSLRQLKYHQPWTTCGFARMLMLNKPGIPSSKHLSI